VHAARADVTSRRIAEHSHGLRRLQTRALCQEVGITRCVASSPRRPGDVRRPTVRLKPHHLRYGRGSGRAVHVTREDVLAGLKEVRSRAHSLEFFIENITSTFASLGDSPT